MLSGVRNPSTTSQRPFSSCCLQKSITLQKATQARSMTSVENHEAIPKMRGESQTLDCRRRQGLQIVPTALRAKGSPQQRAEGGGGRGVVRQKNCLLFPPVPLGRRTPLSPISTEPGLWTRPARLRIFRNTWSLRA